MFIVRFILNGIKSNQLANLKQKDINNNSENNRMQLQIRPYNSNPLCVKMSKLN